MTTLPKVLICFFIGPRVGLHCRKVRVPGAAALHLAQTGPVLGRQDQPRRSPGSGETLALPFLAQFWKNKVSKLAEVKTSSKPGTGAWRGSSCLCPLLLERCNLGTAGSVAAKAASCREDALNALQICGPSAPFAVFFLKHIIQEVKLRLGCRWRRGWEMALFFPTACFSAGFPAGAEHLGHARLQPLQKLPAAPHQPLAPPPAASQPFMFA